MFTAISRSVEAWSADADARAKAASVYEMPLKYGIKDRQPNWKDTNMAFFGTELEKKIKHEASMHEPQWREAGKLPGLQLWRIEHGGLDFSRAVMAAGEFGDAARIDVEAHHLVADSTKADGDGQAYITESDDGDMPFHSMDF